MNLKNLTIKQVLWLNAQVSTALQSLPSTASNEEFEMYYDLMIQLSGCIRKYAEETYANTVY